MPNTTETSASEPEAAAVAAEVPLDSAVGSGEPGAPPPPRSATGTAETGTMSSAASVSSVASVESSAGSERSERSARSMPPPSKLPGLTKATVAKPPGAQPSGAKPSGIKPPGSSKLSKLPSSLAGSNSSIASTASTASRVGRLCDGHGRKAATPTTPTQNASAVLTEDTDSFIIGERVWVGGSKPGRLAYIGDTQFAPGEWAGVVLDDAIGKNDGSVGGVRYFQCEPKKGVFSRLTRLTRYPLPESALAALSSATSPTTPVARKAAVSLAAAPKAASPTPTLSPTGSVRSLAGAELKLGERVIVMSSQTGSKAGILRYKGPTAFASGEWCGVELDEPMGKNDGAVAGTRYFDCQPKFGLFAPAHKVSRSPAPKRLSTANCKVHHRPGLHGSRESLSSIVSARSSIGGDWLGSCHTSCNCTIHLNSLPKYKFAASRSSHGSCNCTAHLLKTASPALRSTPTSSTLRSGLQDSYNNNNYNNYNYTYSYNYDINWEDCY